MKASILWYSLCWAHGFGEALTGEDEAGMVSASFERPPIGRDSFEPVCIRFEPEKARRHVDSRWRDIQRSLRKGDLR